MTSTKTYVNPSEKYDRVVVLIDMDAFYTQVEEYQDLERLKGKPIGEMKFLFTIFNILIKLISSCCSIY